MILSIVPSGLELLASLRGPFFDESGCSFRKRSVHNFASGYQNGCLRGSVFGVEMRWGMVPPVDGDSNSIKAADFRHGKNLVFSGFVTS
jgi:hypothetical protein